MDRALEALFDTLLNDQQIIANRVRVAMQNQLPTYRTMPTAVLDTEVAQEVRWILSAARSGGIPGADHDNSEMVAIGQARARYGVPVDEMLRAWRIGLDAVMDYIRELIAHLNIDETGMLDAVQSGLAWSDVAMLATAEAYHEAGRYVLAEDELRAAFIRGTLFGTVPPTELRVRAQTYGLDPALDYVAVRAKVDQGRTAQALEQTLGFPESGRLGGGLVTLVDDHIAGLLSEPPARDVDGIVGFGPPRPVERLPESYRLASRALMTAQACDLRGAYDIAALGLRVAVAADTDISELLYARYLEPLGDSASSTELITTLRVYLDCGMHVEKAAAQLFVHQNTVRYRLARFEELTGASLRDTKVICELSWTLDYSMMDL